MNKKRCTWCGDSQIYVDYHDKEWGRPVKDDSTLFEMLILEGAQAGLSWETVLNKRENYRKVFHKFDLKKVAKLSDAYLEKALNNPGIIRNRLKVYSTRTNAQLFIEIQKEFGSFAEYLWSYVDHKPIITYHKKLKDYPVTTKISDEISKDLKRRGFKFVGSTIIYAYLQAVGVYQDHATTCDLSGKKFRTVRS